MMNATVPIIAAASSEYTDAAIAATIHDRSGSTGICVGMDTSAVSPDRKQCGARSPVGGYSKLTQHGEPNFRPAMFQINWSEALIEFQLPRILRSLSLLAASGPQG